MVGIFYLAFIVAIFYIPVYSIAAIAMPEKPHERIWWMHPSNTKAMRFMAALPVLLFLFILATGFIINPLLERGNMFAYIFCLLFMLINMYICAISGLCSKFALHGIWGKLAFIFYIMAGCAYAAVSVVMVVFMGSFAGIGSGLMIG
jgi:hypothetical protein